MTTLQLNESAPAPRPPSRVVDLLWKGAPGVLATALIWTLSSVVDFQILRRGEPAGGGALGAIAVLKRDVEGHEHRIARLEVKDEELRDTLVQILLQIQDVNSRLVRLQKDVENLDRDSTGRIRR